MNITQQHEFIKSKLYPSEFFKNKYFSKQKTNASEIIYNFRCCFCGDSKSNKHKKRGYLLWKKQRKYSKGFKFICFNCGRTLDFDKFLKELEIFGLPFYDQYKKNLYLEKTELIEEDKQDLFKFYNFNHNFKSYVKNIEENPSVLEYVKKRMIPEKYWNTKLFSYSGSLYAFIKQDRYGIFREDISMSQFYFNQENWLVLVMESFINGQPMVVGFSLRRIVNSEYKYFKTAIDYTGTTFFSNVLNYADIEDYPLFTLEGEIDSLMLSSPAFAIKGSSLTKINDIEELKNNQKIFIYDNDYKYNKDIMIKLKKLSMKDNVVLMHLDKENKCKDLNEIVTTGYKQYPLDDYVKKYIRSGLSKYFEIKQIRSKA